MNLESSPKNQFRNFHEGEAQIQASVGIDTAAFDRGVEEAFRPALSPIEVRFVGARTFSVAASIDDGGRPWASPLFGPAGALFTVQDDTTVRVKPQPIAGDPLHDNVRSNGEMGVLYFDPSRRRRAKSLGRATTDNSGTFEYRMHRNFGICNKYIFKRSNDVEPSTTQRRNVEFAARAGLSADDKAQLGSTDTTFLASHSDRFGADATHRGGPAGFVSVVDDSTITMPDYMGNGMFQTLGNLQLDDRVGLSSVDFETGRLLQLTGRGSIQPANAHDVYSQRTLLIAIDEVRSSWADVGTWTDIEAFDIQPNMANPATPRARS